MNKHYIDEEIFAYLNGNLPEDKLEAIEDHIIECEKCRKLFESCVEIQAALSEISFDTASDEDKKEKLGEATNSRLDRLKDFAPRSPGSRLELRVAPEGIFLKNGNDTICLTDKSKVEFVKALGGEYVKSHCPDLLTTYPRLFDSFYSISRRQTSVSVPALGLSFTSEQAQGFSVKEIVSGFSALVNAIMGLPDCFNKKILIELLDSLPQRNQVPMAFTSFVKSLIVS